MKTEEITKINALIAEFMGAEFNTKRDFLYLPLPINKGWDVKDLLYHTSWDWLMPVVEKIEELGYYVSIEQNCVSVYDKRETYNWYGGRTSDSKLISTYVGVVGFIKWHNS